MSQKLEQLARDEAFMARALALAERGTGWTSPNPLVGAVIVKDGRIIGEGWHTACGQPHAEREALAARLVDGTFRGVLHAASQCGEPEQQEDLQFLFGALHLKPEERAELLGLIDGYLRTHSVPEGGVEHWEYVLMAYRADEE